MLTIAWDIDDVLNDLTREWLKSCGSCVSYDDLIENPPHGVLKISKEVYLESLDDFRKSSPALKPLKETASWFARNGHKFRHIALTAVPFRFAAKSAEWTIANFGRWIRTYHFVPSFRHGFDIPSYDADKAEFLSWIKKVDCLVDDNEENINRARAAGVRGVLFPRPWNSQKRQDTEKTLEALNEII